MASLQGGTLWRGKLDLTLCVGFFFPLIFGEKRKMTLDGPRVQLAPHRNFFFFQLHARKKSGGWFLAEQLFLIAPHGLFWAREVFLSLFGIWFAAFFEKCKFFGWEPGSFLNKKKETTAFFFFLHLARKKKRPDLFFFFNGKRRWRRKGTAACLLLGAFSFFSLFFFYIPGWSCQ